MTSSFPTESSPMKQTPVHRVQALHHLRGHQWRMRDLTQIFRHGPNLLVGSVPMDSIETAQAHRSRIGPQRLLAPQIVVMLEVRDRKLANGPVNRLAKS